MLISSETEALGIKKCAASIDRGGDLFHSASTKEVNLYFMSDLIPTKKRARKTSLAGLFPNLTASNVGVAFLSAQITDLEQRCAAMRRRISNERPGRTAGRAQPA